jgi:hypothetical protein
MMAIAATEIGFQAHHLAASLEPPEETDERKDN